MKAGYKTTEFWFTLVTFIFSGLFLSGVIKDSDQKDELISSVSHAVESVILIGGQFTIFMRYLNNRSKIKEEYEKTQRMEEENQISQLTSYVGVGKDYQTINLNSATVGELIQLPEIGPSLAGKIIKYRNNNGNFTNPKDITKVSGIGQHVYQSIEQYIEV